MQLHDIKRRTKNKKRMIVARGGTRGKTAGRGTKGQKARAGHKIRPEIRDVIKRIPKMRGRGKNSNLTIEVKPVVIAAAALQEHFADGAVVTRLLLLKKGLISRYKGRIPQVKILGGVDDLKKKLILKGFDGSASVKEKFGH